MRHAALLARLIARQDLSREETRAWMGEVMEGRVDPALLGAMLAAFAAKGETEDELAGAAEGMRARATVVRTPPGADTIDTCGTGGDGKPLFNVSSAAAIVAAAAGASVAKHGNRSYTRPSGSAEGLAALGVNVDADVPALERCLRECRVAFLYAVRLHPAMHYARSVRLALGVRTLFNLIGPLCNPALVRRQLLGVSRPDHVARLARVIGLLGAERALVVHGAEGLCDVSIATTTHLARWDAGRLTFETVEPEDIGAQRHPTEALHVRDPGESAAVIRRVLHGAAGAPREMVLANAAAALWVAGVAADWREGRERASAAIDSGAARATLAEWVRLSCADAAG